MPRLPLRDVYREHMIEVDHAGLRQQQPDEVLQIAGDENGHHDGNVEHEGNKHPHPVALKNLFARTLVEPGLHANVEEPFRPPQQRLWPATEAPADARPPPEEIEEQDKLALRHLFVSLSHQVQFADDKSKNL